jgi:hypothetical protein
LAIPSLFRILETLLSFPASLAGCEAADIQTYRQRSPKAKPLDDRYHLWPGQFGNLQ